MTTTTTSPSRLRCIGSRTPGCRNGKTQAYFAVARTRSCGHHELPIPMCRKCIRDKDPRTDVLMILGQAGRETPCTTCGEPSKIVARLLLHFAVPFMSGSKRHTRGDFMMPLCHTLTEGVVLKTGTGLVEYDATKVPLVYGNTLLRQQVNCQPCLEAMHS